MIPAVVSRGYDAFGRPSGVAVAPGYRIDYGYEAAGRFGSVTATIASATMIAAYGPRRMGT